MATFTADTYHETPRWNLGPYGQVFRYVSTEAFGSQGDVILLAKLPVPIDILDLSLQISPGSISTGAAYTCPLYITPGNSASATSTLALLKNASYSEGTVLQGPGSSFDYPRISLSDDDAIQYCVLKLQVTSASSATVSFSMAGWVLYQTADR